MLKAIKSLPQRYDNWGSNWRHFSHRSQWSQNMRYLVQPERGFFEKLSQSHNTIRVLNAILFRQKEGFMNLANRTSASTKWRHTSSSVIKPPRSLRYYTPHKYLHSKFKSSNAFFSKTVRNRCDNPYIFGKYLARSFQKCMGCRIDSLPFSRKTHSKI